MQILDNGVKLYHISEIEVGAEYLVGADWSGPFPDWPVGLVGTVECGPNENGWVFMRFPHAPKEDGEPHEYRTQIHVRWLKPTTDSGPLIRDMAEDRYQPILQGVTTADY